MVKSKFEKEIEKKEFRVTIFGSARIKKNDVMYKQVHGLANEIASLGMDVITGGGPGLMHAANAGHNRGKKSNKAHTLGLRIKLPFEQKTNKHLDLYKDFERFSDRLDYFMLLSNAVVVAPGGIGTALEFFYTWQLTQVKHICHIPIILLGPMWAELIKWVEKYPLKKNLISKKDMQNVFVAKNNAEAMKIIKMFHETYLKGNGKTCLNIKKYKLK